MDPKAGKLLCSAEYKISAGRGKAVYSCVDYFMIGFFFPFSFNDVNIFSLPKSNLEFIKRKEI